MSRRIEVELTSRRDDDTWTWRAAGAREPKGVVAATLLPDGAATGDVLRAEVDFTVDGIDVISVAAPKAAKVAKDQTLELIGTRRDEPGVTTSLVAKSGRGRGDRGGRDRDRGGPRGDDRGARRGPPKRTGRDRRDERGSGDRGADGRRNQERTTQDAPGRPAPKRLKARRTYRNRLLAELPDEQRPLAEMVLQGGVPAVRHALERQQTVAREHGQPPVRGELLVELAERLLPGLKSAEWRDRAEAALRQVDDVDLRDLRSVVSAADRAGRDEDSRALAEQLRTALTARVDREHQEWLAELSLMVQDGRIVRALRLSSRPPKAGAPLPADLAARLAEQATTGLTAEVTQERFATLLEAVSFSPVHERVAATSIPAEPSKELLGLVRRMGSRVPAVAAQFGARDGAAPATSAPTSSAAEPAVTPTR